MAVVQELIAKLGFHIDQTGAQKVDNQLGSLASKAAMLAGAYMMAGKAIGTVIGAVKQAADLEALNAEFEVLLKNADAAKYLTQQILDYAIPSPFAAKSLANNVRLMMSFGQSANQAFDAVKRIGDIAGADEDRLNRLSLAYAQTMSATKLDGRDLLQYVSAGFNPLAQIAKKSGKSMGTLRKEMEKGKISAEMVTEALVEATSAGGMFFGNTAKQASTLKGLWSNMLDGFRLMSAELGGRLVPFIKAVIIGVINMTDSIAGAYRQLSDFFGLLFSDGPTAGDVASYVAAGFQTIADAIMLGGTAFQLFKFLFVKAANEMAAEVWNLVDALAMIPKTGIKGLKALAEVGYKLQGLTSGNTKEDTKRYNKEIRTYDTIYQFLGGDEGYEGSVRKTGDIENNANWDKFIELGKMIGQSKDADPTARMKLNDDILKRLEATGKVVTVTTNVNNTIHAEGTMKDILQEQANSIFGLTFQQTLIAASV